MVRDFSRARVRLLLLSASTVALLGACTQGFDYDLRGMGGGFSTSDAARQVGTQPRPQPDNRGVISYPNYQVAVAERGDTIQSVATRLGVDAPTLARFNGIDETAASRGISRCTRSSTRRVPLSCSISATPVGLS